MTAHVYPIDVESFPRAARYVKHALSDGVVRERRTRPEFLHSERHLQCAWYDSSLRPSDLVTSEGEKVEVLDPGVWNLEAGPDFKEASILLGDSRRVAGDVEIHIHSSGWTAHGHGEDPLYRNVRFHVTYYDDASPDTVHPPASTHIPLAKALAANPLFDFESIDVTAFPYASISHMPPCAAHLHSWTAQQKGGLLEAAGEERLRRKMERMACEAASKGFEQVLYEHVMAALGFKNNKSVMRLVAQRLPAAALQRASSGHTETAYALLLGISGLLPTDFETSWDSSTHTLVRRLWNIWAKSDSDLRAAQLPADGWNLSSMRPANHPLRRLAAAAQLFGGGLLQRSLHEILKGPVSQIPLAVCALLENLRDPYWSHFWALGGKRVSRPVSLIGATRAAAIATNVIVPFAAAQSGCEAFTSETLDRLPPEAANSVIKRTAHALFGRDHPSSLYSNTLRKQGLMQIFHDFCLNCRSDCASCPLPGLLDRSAR